MDRVVIVLSIALIMHAQTACDSDTDTDAAAETDTQMVAASVPLPETEAECETGGYTWVVDESSYFGPDGPQPGPTDEFCVERCNLGCPDPGRPACSARGLYSGGDSNCNDEINVCSAEYFDDCN